MERKLNFLTYKNGQDQADCLRHHRRISCTLHIPMKACHEDQICNHIDRTRDTDKQERQSRITDSTENAADQIISYNKYDSSATDADVGDRLIHRSRRCLHHRCQCRGKSKQKNCHNRCKDCKRYDRTTDHLAQPLLVILSDVTSHQNRDSHRKTV